MDVMLRRMVARLLRNAGFEAVESRALEILVGVFEDRIISFLRTATQLAALSGRPSVSMLDLFGMNQGSRGIVDYRMLSREMLAECGSNVPKCRNRNVEELLSLISVVSESYFHETVDPEDEWISSLSTRVEKFIHIYDFMPSFPPIHTFRMTIVKNYNLKNQSSKVKSRLEQSLRSEGNMIRLIKSSGSIPNFINYIYKNK